MTSTRAALPRRRFLGLSAAGTLAALGDLGFLAHLPRVASAEAKVDPARVRLRPEIEPLVRLLEDTPRERVLEEVAARIRRGLGYREVLAALLLAGVRNIQPRPVGFKFHAVLVVNSAHLASLASPDSDRWLPIFWALDHFKSSQAADERDGDWTMGPVDESAVPAADKARARRSSTRWTTGTRRRPTPRSPAWRARPAPGEIFELFCRYGARDFREIGHKAIYVANSFRTLESIGWQHAEPVLRSLAYALLDRGRRSGNPADARLPADRPCRRNQDCGHEIRGGLADGRASADGDARDAPRAAPGDAEAASSWRSSCSTAASRRSRSGTPASRRGELLMRSRRGSSRCTRPRPPTPCTTPGSAAATTGRAGCCCLQNAAFLPLFRGEAGPRRRRSTSSSRCRRRSTGPGAIEEIFAEVGRDRAGRRPQGRWASCRRGGDARALVDAARRLMFLKGNDAHDYKFSSAVLEDAPALAASCRARCSRPGPSISRAAHRPTRPWRNGSAAP